MPETTVESLVPVQRAAAQVVSAPVTLTLGPTRWRLPRWRLAKMLQLPSGKETSLRLGGPDADVYFAALQRRVGRVPRDAGWESTSSGGVRVIPSAPGYALDVLRTAARVLAAAESSSNR